MIVHKTNNAAITMYYLHSCILLAEISNNVNYSIKSTFSNKNIRKNSNL